MKTTLIESLPNGEFVRKPKGKRVFIKKEYCRLNKAYELQAWDDISHYIYVKKGSLVEYDFEF